MDEIRQIRKLYDAKGVLRKTEHNGRQESVSDHVFSSIILAKYLIRQYKIAIDEQKVIDLLLVHDYVEIYAGDTFILDDNTSKEQKEKDAFEALQKQIPSVLLAEYIALYQEYEARKTPEAQFTKAIDQLDPMVTNIFDYEIWRRYKFTEEKLREKKQADIDQFPQIKPFFEKLLKHLKDNDAI